MNKKIDIHHTHMSFPSRLALLREPKVNLGPAEPRAACCSGYKAAAAVELRLWGLRSFCTSQGISVGPWLRFSLSFLVSNQNLPQKHGLPGGSKVLFGGPKKHWPPKSTGPFATPGLFVVTRPRRSLFGDSSLRRTAKAPADIFGSLLAFIWCFFVFLGCLCFLCFCLCFLCFCLCVCVFFCVFFVFFVICLCFCSFLRLLYGFVLGFLLMLFLDVSWICFAGS